MRIRMTDEREDRLRRLMQATGESTKSGALAAAAKHYLADLRNKKQVADEFHTELVGELHTPWLPLNRETRIGAEE